MKNLYHVLIIIGIFLFTFLLIGCGQEAATEPKEETAVTEPTIQPPPTDTPIPPTNTPIPPTNTPEPTNAPPPFNLTADIIYWEDGDPKHTLDVFLPITGEAPYQTVFILHPGGFSDGMKEWMFPFSAYFTSQGMAVVTINYRLTPEHIYPAQLEDTFCALAWIHSNAESFGFNSERIVTFGYSAGANLASMVGAVDDPTLYLEGCPHTLPYADWTQGAINLSGRTDLVNFPTDGIATYLGSSVDDMPELWQEASPITHLDESDPPFLVAHGTADELLPFEVSELFVTALSEAGIENSLVPIPDAGHFFPSEFESEQTAVFLNAATEFITALPARPPIQEKPRVLMTSAEQLVGVWTTEVSFGAGARFDFYFKYTEDGRFLREQDVAEFSELSGQGDYWFEDGVFHLVYDPEHADFFCNGREVVGRYEIEILSDEEIKFHRISDTCSNNAASRASNFQSSWERVE